MWDLLVYAYAGPLGDTIYQSEVLYGVVFPGCVGIGVVCDSQVVLLLLPTRCTILHNIDLNNTN